MIQGAVWGHLDQLGANTSAGVQLLELQQVAWLISELVDGKEIHFNNWLFFGPISQVEMTWWHGDSLDSHVFLGQEQTEG